MKPRKSETGSTLLLTVITLSLLTVLATALMSMTTMNVGNKYTDKAIKQTHYYAESGVEEAYTLVSQSLQEVLMQAQSEVDTYIKDIVEQDIQKAIGKLEALCLDLDGRIDEAVLQGLSNETGGTYTIVNHVVVGHNDLEKVYKTFLTEQLAIQTDAIQHLIDEKYKEIFIQEWNKAITDTTATGLIQQLEKEEYYIYNNPVDVEGIVDMVVKADGSVSPTTISIKATTVEREGQLKREISADLVVQAPDLKYPIQIKEEMVIDNPIWKYGLVAGKDMIIQDRLKVVGNTYAYGTMPIDKTNLQQFGGIVLEDGAKVQIQGDVVTNSFIQTKGVDATLEIEGGNVFCNSLVVQKGNSVDQDMKARINIVNSYVYTQDDIELNGNGSQINIEGKYIGFSDGSENTDGKLGHDTSSCIVINATDLGRGSTLGIAKQTTPMPPQGGMTAKKVADFNDLGIIIPGTAWIEGRDYQTGESVSVKGNYIGYMWRFNDEELLREKSIYDVDRVYEAEGLEIPLVEGYIQEDGTKQPYNVAQKDHYFNKAYEKVYRPNAEVYPEFNTGGKGLAIDKEDYTYTLGSSMYQPIAEDGYTIQTGQGITPDKVKEIISNVRKDYQYILQYLKYRHKEMLPQDAQFGKDAVAHYINLHPEQPTFNSLNAGTILYYDPTKDLHIQNGQLNGAPITGGILITGGNITIEGEWEFEGTLIAGGNIVIKDTGATGVNIVNNSETQKRIGNLVNGDVQFQTNFQNGSSYQANASIMPGLGDSMAYQYKDLIAIKNWRPE